MADGEGLMASAGIDKALSSVSVPKQSELPKIPPKLLVQHDDTLVKGCEHQVLGDMHSQSNVEPDVCSSGTLQTINPDMNEEANTCVMLEIRNAAATKRKRFAGEISTTEALKKTNPEMVLLRMKHLQNLGEEPRPRHKDIITYFQNVEDFIAKVEVSSLHEVLPKERDLVFLQQLLLHVLEIADATKVTSPPTNSPPSDDLVLSPPTNSAPPDDLVLKALAAAPSCHRRANAELLHQLLISWYK